MRKIYFLIAILSVISILPISGNTKNYFDQIYSGGELIVAIDKQDASGADVNDAYIRLKITGGKAPYKIHCFSPYSFPSQSQGNELKLEKIKSGDYLFVIQDSEGNLISKEIKISNNR